ncbi:TonB-dependent receptor [Dyadobacter bucti]|uniref:TonB-dependent receptor n=1 Tax=Dyadobacter bucti TaxID=2572203 RepID=UPI003F6E9439
MKKRRRFKLWLSSALKISLLLTFIIHEAVSAGPAGWQELMDRKITMKGNQVELKSVLNQISKTLDVNFTYNSKAIQAERKVDINFNDVRLAEVLDRLLKPLSINHFIVDGQILLRPSYLPRSQGRADEETDMSTKIADRSISGKIIDEKGEALPGVSIVLKGTQRGTSTNEAGSYTLEVPEGDGTLIFSFVGYISQEVNLANKTTVDVTLHSDTKALEEIVVVGYGSMEKSDITGSMSSVKATELSKVPFPRADQALQGQAAGVVVSNFGSQPGGQVNIRIRGGNSINGSNDPLIVVDGILGVDFNSVNPNDIESMDILKDASATAIYGSRGSNGVIIITTKRGKSGKTQVSYSNFFTFSQVSKKMDLLNAREHYQLLQEIGTYSSVIANYDPNIPGTDWQKEVFRTAPTMEHQLALSGGSEKTQFRISANYFDQDGIIKNTGFKRGTLRFNLDHSVSDKLKIGLNFNALRSAQDNTIINAGAGSDGGGVTQAAFRFSPLVPVYDANGNYSKPLLVGSQINNPMAIVNDRTDKLITNNLQSLLYADWKITKDLSFRSSIAYTLNQSTRKYWASSNLLEAAGMGAGKITSAENTFWLSENILTYDKSFNRHKINAVAGFTAQGADNFSAGATGKGFSTESLIYNNLSISQINQMRVESNAVSSNIASFLGRINYSFDNKYLFTVSGRADGSSKFSKNHKWGFFPSAAAGWRISEEEFLRTTDWVSNLKLRASYGATGSEAIRSYQSLATMNITTYSLGTSELVGLNLGSVANPDLKWETTYQTNVGLDVGLLNNRLSLVVDYFNKSTRDLLYPKNVPFYTGYSTQIQNVGTMRNQGWEFSATSVNTTKGLKWSTTANFSIMKNKIVDLGGDYEYTVNASGGTIADFSTTGIMRVGQPAGLFYGYIFDGIYQNQGQVDALPAAGAKPGAVKFKDLDNDGVITTKDRTIIGNPQPKFIFGLTNNFSYKSFSLSTLIQGTTGNKVFNINRYLLEWPGRDDNTLRSTLGYWRGDGTSNTMQALGEAPGAMSTRFIEDGSYLRLKNVMLAYDLPAAWSQKLGISNFKIYVSAQNLLTITDYSGFDPEVNSRTDNWTIGIDYGAYPSVKAYTVGLNLNF